MHLALAGDHSSIRSARAVRTPGRRTIARAGRGDEEQAACRRMTSVRRWPCSGWEGRNSPCRFRLASVSAMPKRQDQCLRRPSRGDRRRRTHACSGRSENPVRVKRFGRWSAGGSKRAALDRQGHSGGVPAAKMENSPDAIVGFGGNFLRTSRRGREDYHQSSSGRFRIDSDCGPAPRPAYRTRRASNPSGTTRNLFEEQSFGPDDTKRLAEDAEQRSMPEGSHRIQLLELEVSKKMLGQRSATIRASRK